MSKTLPERADLEHLKGQAKALLVSLRESGDSASRLADAQRILARDYGFPSWAKLKRHLESDRKATFFNAIRAGNRRAVARLLKEDPSLVRETDPDSFDAPVLNLAAERNDAPMIELLIEHGADPNQRSTWWAGGFRPLDFADEPTSRLLIGKGATLTAHAASRLGLVTELKGILASNPDSVRERGGDGQFPLHFAATPEIVDLLVDAGAELDARDLDHSGTAAQFQIENASVCRRLLERGATPDIYIAVMLEDVALIEEILADDPGCQTRNPLDPGNPMTPHAPGAHICAYSVGALRPFQVAWGRGKKRALETLERQASPKVRLMSALWRGDRTTAVKLSGEVGSLDATDRSILPQAAWERMTDSVRLMLEIGLDVNSTGVHNSTALDRAAIHGFDDVIEAILPFGPSLEVRNEFGGRPLEACLWGSEHSWRKDGDFRRSLELLIEAGAELPPSLRGSQAARETLQRHGVSSTV